MTPNFEQLLAQARALPPVDRLRLAGLLLREEAQPAVIQAERSAVVAEVCGKYAALAPSTEEWMAQKRAEVELEERRYEMLFGHGTEQPE